MQIELKSMVRSVDAQNITRLVDERNSSRKQHMSPMSPNTLVRELLPTDIEA